MPCPGTLVSTDGDDDDGGDGGTPCDGDAVDKGPPPSTSRSPSPSSLERDVVALSVE